MSTINQIPDVKVQIPSAFLPWLFQPYRYKAAYGGRGGAKSHTFATALVVMATSQRLRILCAREIQNSLKQSVKKLLEDKIVNLGVADRYKITKDGILCLLTGSTFDFAGLYRNVSSIKSSEGIDICWIEEADSVSSDSLDKLKNTIRKPNSEMWFSWNPETGRDPVGQMFLSENPRKNAFIKKITYADNPWFMETSNYEEMLYDKEFSYSKYSHVWLGNPVVNTELQVFGRWKVAYFDTPPDTEFLFGADWGFSVDPTVLVRFWVDQDKRQIFVDHEAYQVRCEIADTPALFDQVPGVRDWTIRADGARPEMISHMRNAGFNMIKAVKAPGSVVSGVTWLQDYEIIVHDRCVHVADELTLYSYKKHTQTGDPTPNLEDKNNHTIDALRYGSEPLHVSMITSFEIQRVA